MTTVANPTFTPNGGQVNVDSTFELACVTADADIYFTFGTTDPSTTNWTKYTVAVPLSHDSGVSQTVRAYAVKAGSTDSSVVTKTFYTVGYSGAVGADAPAILDTNSTQGLGAVCEGIGKTGADGASIGGQRIGASGTTTDLKYEYGDGPGV